MLQRHGNTSWHTQQAIITVSTLSSAINNRTRISSVSKKASTIRRKHKKETSHGPDPAEVKAIERLPGERGHAKAIGRICSLISLSALEERVEIGDTEAAKLLQSLAIRS